MATFGFTEILDVDQDACDQDELVLRAEALGAESQGVADDIPYCEVAGSPNESFVMDGSMARRTFFVPYCYRQRFIRQMIGFPFMDGAEMSRRLPAFHPEWVNVEGKPFLFATKAESRGVGFRHQNDIYDEPLAYYDLAEVTIVYESLPFTVALKSEIAGTPKEFYRYVKKRTRSAGEYLTAEWGGWVWTGSGNAAIDDKQAMGSRIGIWQGLTQVVYTWFDVHPDAFNRVRAEGMAGKINNADFDSYPAGSLLLTSVNYEPRQAPTGIRTLEVTFEMIYKVQKHNFFLHPTGFYYEVAAKGDNTRKPLQTANFTELFTP